MTSWPQEPLSKRVPYICGKLDFWWSIPQKMTSIGYFGASYDQTIRIRLQRPLRPISLKRFLMPEKSLLRTSESSKLLNSIILRFYLDFLKKKSFDRIIKRIMLNFSIFSVSGQWGCVRSGINFNYSGSHWASFLVDLSKHLVKPGLYFMSKPNGTPC